MFGIRKSARRFSAILARKKTAACRQQGAGQKVEDTRNFVAGQDTITNTHTTTTAIKDAMDGGTPAGSDAVGRDLAFHFGWRDGGSMSSGSLLVDDFTVGGLLEANDATLRPVPEPSCALLALAGSTLLFARRRRR